MKEMVSYVKNADCFRCLVYVLCSLLARMLLNKFKGMYFQFKPNV